MRSLASWAVCCCPCEYRRCNRREPTPLRKRGPNKCVSSCFVCFQRAVYSLRNHRCYLSFVCDIATDANCLVTGGNEFFCRRANGVLLNVGKSHRSSRFREGFGGHQPHARGSASNECDFVL